MATISTTPTASRRASGRISSETWRHRLLLGLAWLLAAGFVLAISIYGFPYYRLDLAERAESPLHGALRPSGPVGLRLGMLGVALFAVLFLYPVRKYWPWLARIGKTKNWLDFHVLCGIVAPLVVTLHATFKFGGLAGLAYWIMVVVALSGFVGRYLFAQIPRSISTAELSLKEMEATAGDLARQLHEQAVVSQEEIAPLLALPSREEVAKMSLAAAFWSMLRLDLRRPWLVGRLRRKSLSPGRKLLTLGGWLPSGHSELEGVISAVRSQSWMSAKMLFLGRVQAVFHLWHVIHRPFSYSFAVLVGVHIGVVLLLGYY
jgi:hypothetical protein